ncbi:MAG: hypothetical protein Rhims3KO_35160 [Hyphomicrobiales bacterium]
MSDRVTPQGLGPSDETLRARLDAGIDVRNSYGWGLILSGFYDSLGALSYHAYGGQAQSSPYR